MTARKLVAWHCQRCNTVIHQPTKVKRVLHRCEIPGRTTTTTELQRTEEP